MRSSERAPQVYPRAAAIILVIAVALFLARCGRPVSPLTGGSTSAAMLAAAVVSAFERGDIATLRTLALNEHEFRDHVWPELPAAKPERNLPFSFVWGDLHQKSEAALSRTIQGIRGQRFRVISVEALGGTTQYKTYAVHRETQLTVKNAEGQEQRIRLFGSVLEKDGHFKVFSYVTD
jgi:hypothetical protein